VVSYEGLLVVVGDETDPVDATIDVGNGRIAVRAGNATIGAWRLSQVAVRPVEEVVCLSIDGEELAFLPITPGFREAVTEQAEVQKAPRARPTVGAGVVPPLIQRSTDKDAAAGDRRLRYASRVGIGIVVIAAAIGAATMAFGGGADDAQSSNRVGPALAAEGTGDAVVEIMISPEQLTIFEIEHRGRGPFAITALSTGGDYIAEVVAGVGSYEGRRLLEVTGSDTAVLQVRADGRWRIAVQPLGGAPTLSGTVSGEGDEVVIFVGTRTSLGIGHEGLGTFVVEAYGPSGRAVLASQVGVYTGNVVVPRGTVVVTVQADGAWVLSPR
jgi:hypothetical protein